MAVLSIGQVWAAEDDTHDFGQSISQSMNSCATFPDIVIPEQSYSVKSVVITYAYNKTIKPQATVTIGETEVGTQDFESTGNLTTFSTLTFTPDSPIKGAVTITNTASSNCTGSGKGTLKVTNVQLVEGPAAGGLDKCSTPSISPAACSFYGSQQVTITCATEDAAIYYTIDESIPSSSNGTLYPGSAITVSGATTTVKAIAIKDGLDDSDVASVTYTYAGAAVSGYAIDFESDLVAYVDWEFTNLALRTSSNNGVTPHSGTYYAANATSSSATSGTASAIITTKDKVAKPGVLTFYISKESNNTSASSWVAQVSEDGDTWTDVETFDAKSMSKGSWNECVADLSEYTNVYVRISYGSSTALRAIDDINLEMASAVNKPIISGDDNFYPTTTVTLTQAAADAIYYTTNGDAPTTGSTLYEGPFELNATATVKAIAIKDEVASAVAEKTFTKIVPWSVAEANEQLAISTPQNGKYVRGIISQIDGYSSNAITYWISDDGSTTDQLEVYKGKGLNNTNFSAITDLSLGEVVVVYGNLKVFEPSSGGSINEFDAGNYLISKEAPAVAAPVFSPDGGGFMGETDVTITCETEGSAIYYTLDGTTPSKSSTPYTAAIHLNATTTITAVAYVGDDASLVIAKTFTLTAPMTVAEALAALESENPINNVAVAGIISTAPTANPSSGKLTYFISDDGSASDELEVYKGFGVAGASFSDKTDLQVGDEVTVFGNLTIYNTTKEFAEGNRLIAFNRPVVPSISADPVAVDAAAHAGQSVTITYENWGAVSVADADATLWNNEACDEAFSGEWISNVSVAVNFESVSFDIAANTGEARTAYMKIYALGDDNGTTEAEKVIAIAQEAYVAPALPAELPFAFDGGRADVASTQGMSQEGLDTDYSSSPKLKFNSTGDVVIINIASDPGKLTYSIKNNSFSGGTFDVQESADGETYTSVASYTEITGTQNEEHNLKQATRFVKFIYTEKSSGNVGLGNIAIAAYVAPAPVENPAFSVAEGTYLGAQNVEITCATDGATIYYTIGADPADPTSGSTEYTGAIAVSSTTTIKAIAILGENSSTIASATYTIVTLEHAGTAEDPYTVADARTAIDAGVGVANVYATGIVSEIVTAYNSQFHNISYNISADGLTTSDQLQAFRGKDKDGANFTSEDDVQVGDEVVVYGNLTKYGETYEFGQDNQRYSFTRPGDPVLLSIAISEDPTKTTYDVGDVFDVTGLVVTGTYDQGDPAAIASGITWEVRTNSTSEAVALGAYTLALNQTALQVRATVSAIASEWYDVTGLTVKEHEITPDRYEILLNNALWGSELTGSLSGDNLKDYSGSQNDISFAYNKGTGSNMYFNATQTRLYNGNELVVTAPTGYVIEKVEGLVATVQANAGTIAENVWTGNVNSVTFSHKNSTGNSQLATIYVTFAEYVPATVAAPTFSLAAGEYTSAQNVTITCETDGATIYYTTDNSTPDNTKTQYTGAISVSESMTIKAIAYKDAEYSDVATATYTINIVVVETPVATDSKWVAATEVVDGMQVLIVGVNNTDYFAAGIQNNNNRAAVAASVDGEGVLTPGENTMAFTVVEQPDGTFALRTSNGKYLYAASSGSNWLRSQDELDDNGKWTLTVSSAVANGTNTRNTMQFNSGSSCFACYGSASQKPIKLYVPKPAQTPDPVYTEVRTGLIPNAYYTICLDRAVNSVKEGSIWKVVSKAQNDKDIILEAVTTTEAGRPYIIFATASTFEVEYTGDAVDDPVNDAENHGLFGSFQKASITENDGNYIIYENALYLVNTDNVKVGDHRAYLHMAGVPDYNGGSAAPGRRRVTMTVHGEQVATGMESIQDSEISVQKVMIDGQLFILRGEKMYNASGLLVK